MFVLQSIICNKHDLSLYHVRTHHVYTFHHLIKKYGGEQHGCAWWWITYSTTRRNARIVELEGATSRVWDYFGFPAKNDKFLEPDKKKWKRVYCKLWARDFSYVGNTTTMWQHLKDSHLGHFKQAKTDELRMLVLAPTLVLPVLLTRT